MQSTGSKIAVLVVALAAIVALFVVLSGDDDSGDSETAGTPTLTTATDAPGDPAPPPTGLVITIGKDGKPEGGIQELSVNKGDVIRFGVRSAVPEEIHLHGYDVTEPVVPGKLTTVKVPATIEGIFEAELHGNGEPILELTVNP